MALCLFPLPWAQASREHIITPGSSLPRDFTRRWWPNKAGIEYTGAGVTQFWSNGQYGTKSSTSITMSIPADGYVLVMHTGSCVFFDESKKISLGVGTSSFAQTFAVSAGYLDESGGDRFCIPYTTTSVFSVSGRTTRTFYATGWASSTFDAGSCNFRTSSLVGIFIPKRY